MSAATESSTLRARIVPVFHPVDEESYRCFGIRFLRELHGFADFPEVNEGLAGHNDDDIGLLNCNQAGRVLKVWWRVEHDVGVLILGYGDLHLRAGVPDALRAGPLLIEILLKS